MVAFPKEFQVALWSIDGIGRSKYRLILAGLSYLGLTWHQWWSRPQKYQAQLRVSDKVIALIHEFNARFTPKSYLTHLAEQGISVMTESEIEYPTQLKFLDDHPPVLFYKGTWAALGEWPVAVVGTRQITSYGRLVTNKIVGELVTAGVSIVSGFMYGVDATAHQRAVAKGGTTVGVLGFGFDHLFPAHFESWFKELLAGGQLFVTEYAPYVPPNKGTFPARNRLIAGLSLGVVVTEAASRSGSHITADWAAEYGRQVYAVPGPITNIYAEGTRSLINQGAVCVSSGQEILTDLGLHHRTSSPSPRLINSLSDISQRLYQELSFKPHTLTTLSQELQQPAAVILGELGILEVSGLVNRAGKGWQVTAENS